MKPIGHNAGAEEFFALDSDAAHSAGSVPAAVGVRSAQIEDILATLPSAKPVTMSALSGNVETETPSPVRVSVDFVAYLDAAVVACDNAEDAQSAAAATLHKHASIQFVGWYCPGGDRIGQTEKMDGLTGELRELPPEHQRTLQALVAATQNGSKPSRIYDPATQSFHTASPIRGASGECLVTSVFETGPVGDSARCAAIDLTIGRLAEWYANSQRKLAIKNSQHVAALIELIGQVTSCSSARAISQSLTTELRKYLGATEVSFALCPDQQLKCRLEGTSSLPIADAYSDATRLRETVLQESIARATASIWPATDAANRHSLLSHQQFAKDQQSVAVVSTPLRNDAGEMVGAIAATFDSMENAQSALSFLFASERSLAAAIQSVSKATRGSVPKMASTCRRLVRSAKLKMGIAACAVLTGVMFIPMDYRLSCETELQPVSRRFVAAPFASPLEECLVEPGDVVETGDLLAVLDGRELRWELSGVQADLAKATKEHNSHLSLQEFGQAAIARHEIDRLQNQSALLNQRMQNLEIRSPIAGVVVAGDLKETEGVPLETGQSMFEVAPLDRMVVEIAIPEDDIQHVELEMSLELRLDAIPSAVLTATILRIQPRAELRDHKNVFIVEAQIDNSDRRFRPGMRGDAKVSTGAHFVGWNLFHKPVAAARGWLGW